VHVKLKSKRGEKKKKLFMFMHAHEMIRFSRSIRGIPSGHDARDGVRERKIMLLPTIESRKSARDEIKSEGELRELGQV
jgi:hypothetical protein